MEDEIDLRVYIAALLRRKFWIGGLAFAAAVAALGVSLLLSPVYEARALVAVIEPRYLMRFDPRFETLDDPVAPPYKAYPALATGDEVILALITALGNRLEPDASTVTQLRRKLEAQSGPDPSLIELAVRDQDPHLAATMVNRWAELFVERANELYGEGSRNLAFFETQLAEAQTTLARAEQDLIAFQARNESTILQAQLDSERAAMHEYLQGIRSLRLIIQDAKSLQERLRSQDPTTRASLGDELTSLLLEVDALNRGTLPIQLQIAGHQGLTDRTVGEQIAFLDSLIRVLGSKQAILEQEVNGFEPGILALQERLQKVNVEADRLVVARSLAQETFTTLSRKVSEARIAAQDTLGDVRIASQAIAPERPISPRKLVNTAVAGLLGLVIASAGVLALDYWKSGQETAAA